MDAFGLYIQVWISVSLTLSDALFFLLHDINGIGCPVLASIDEE